MGKFGKGSKHTLETRQKMSASRMGKKRSEETKRKISEGNQRTKALARGPLPEKSQCKVCTEREGRRVMKPLKEFYIRTRVLKSGEPTFYVYPYCKSCERERIYARRAGMSLEERRRQQNRYNASHRRRTRKAKAALAKQHRLDKGPFVEWFIRYRDEHAGMYEHDGQFDAAGFAHACGITKTQYESLTRLARPNSETHTVTLHLVERVLLSLDQRDMLAVLYPDLA